MENYIVFIILFIILLILSLNKNDINENDINENYINIKSINQNKSLKSPKSLKSSKSLKSPKIKKSNIQLNIKSPKIKSNSPSKMKFNSPSRKLKSITQDQLTANHAKALVLSCMDFRLVDDTVTFMNKKGYNNNYNEFILSGASLGYNQETFPEWKQLLNKHIELAKEINKITEVLVIDHMKCDAYKTFYNKPDLSETEELSLHETNLRLFKENINKTFPELKVYTYLMQLDGTVKLMS
jgi:hypothetical protein